MALPYLPATEIAPMFNQLEKQDTNTKLQTFAHYISKRWIKWSTWPPSSWSVFKEEIRTNNHIEGFHNALKRRAAGKRNLQFYSMIILLHKEARLTSLQIRLVWQNISRTRRRASSNGFVKVTAEILIFILCQQMFQILTQCRKVVQDVNCHHKDQLCHHSKEVSSSLIVLSLFKEGGI
jgi:hypothetical protein